MCSIEWHILNVLRDHDDVLLASVGDPRLVEHIGVSSSKVTDYYTGLADQRDSILNQVIMNPDIVSSLAMHARRTGRRLKRRIYGHGTKLSIEGHPRGANGVWHEENPEVVQLDEKLVRESIVKLCNDRSVLYVDIGKMQCLAGALENGMQDSVPSQQHFEYFSSSSIAY